MRSSLAFSGPPQTTAETVLAQHRVTRLAAMLPVHRAFHWLHLYEQQMRLWQLELLAIPAPTFHESSRAAWFLERFRDLGLTEPHLDGAGNVLAELPAAQPNAPVLLLSAHLDTVFPPGTPTAPSEDGPRILGPGACDNGAGLAALLGLAASLRYAQITPPVTLLFAANVGEEGEGDLAGMRHLFLNGEHRERICAAIALEGSGTTSAVTRALGSRRFRVTITGPGGHSWTDAGLPNPIILLSRGIAALSDFVDDPYNASPETARTVLSPGQISGGTSINSIPASASVSLDLRSTSPGDLVRYSEAIHRILDEIVAEENLHHSEASPARLAIEPIGDRPAGELPQDAPLLHSLRAVDRHLGLRTELRLGSTDANIPLARGVPALAIAAGGTGGGIHTLQEWYDPTGREIALRRILLLLLDVAATCAG